MTWDTNLDGKHKAIAGDLSTVVHVLAGPGTGKTYSMMRRIARLLEEGVSPDRLLAVTFTRTAARDLREQLADLKVPGADKVRSSTLHSLCFGILATQQAFDFTQRAPRPLLTHEIDCLESDLSGAFEGKRATRRLLAAYEAAWARLQKDAPGHAPAAQDQAFEAQLVAWLRFHQAMLIGELVPLTLTFLKTNPAVVGLPPLDHVLVDEYQDLNKADQSLIRMLAATSSILVIGDDNQSIYSFRYANPEGIRTFPTELPGVQQYVIEECRRCPPNIVAMSNALISHDPHTTRPSPLVPDSSKPNADAWIVQHDTLADEVSGAADFIHRYLEANPSVAAGRMLVLTPRRFIGNAIKDALIARGRNALSYFQEDALKTQEAAEGFTLLTLLNERSDRPAIRAWLGLAAQDARARTYTRVRAYCETNALPLDVVLDRLVTGEVRIPYSQAIAARWSELNTRLGELAGLSGLDLVNKLWPQGIVEAADMRLLASRIAFATPEPKELFAELRDAITQPELPGSAGDIIQVMSLHKSKGLTRDVVVIAGCMAGTLPHVDDDLIPEVQAAKLEEQRRLFYVAITRATKVLLISSARQLPLADALRGGAKVTQKTYIGGVPYAVTTSTPFISELGATAPTSLLGSVWRKQVGLG